MKEKIKELWRKNKKTLLSLCLTLLIFVAFSVAAMLIFMAFGIVSFDGGVQFNGEIFDSFKNSWYGWIIFILVQILFTTLLSFVPGTSMAFIMLTQTLYENPWHAFLISFIGVMLSSTMMYVAGRFGGYKICTKMLGEEDCEKASQLLNNKGAVYFPIMMLFPAFPDDALIMIAGMLKMSLKWFIPSIVIGRGIGIATIVFGLSIVPFDQFTTPFHWIGFILLCAAGIAAVFYLAYRFNKFLEKRKNT